MNTTELVRALETKWKEINQGEVESWASRLGGTVFAFADMYGPYKVFVTLILGRKRGLREEVHILDTREWKLADRLCFAQRCNNDGNFLPLNHIREEMFTMAAADPKPVVERLMRELVMELREVAPDIIMSLNGKAYLEEEARERVKNASQSRATH